MNNRLSKFYKKIAELSEYDCSEFGLKRWRQRPEVESSIICILRKTKRENDRENERDRENDKSGLPATGAAWRASPWRKQQTKEWIFWLEKL